MGKQWLSEERTRRLQELRAKYRQPKPKLITFDEFVCWRSQEVVGYQRRDDDYWQVLTGEVEVVSGEVVRVWIAEEMWLPLRHELFDHCPPLDTPPEDWWGYNSPPLA